MKIAAAVFADFERNFLDGPSQLRAPLGSRPILAHTLSRLLRVDGLDHRCLFVQPRDREAAVENLREWGLEQRIDVLVLDDGNRPRRGLLRSARKWNLESWRGGLLGATWFDEYVEPRCAALVLDQYQCEGVLCLDGHQAALDVSIASAMLAHQREFNTEAKLVFTQAPPGLAGIILRRQGTRELLEQEIPVGILLSYRPEIPQGDPITRDVCFHVAAPVAQTSARFVADTRRSRERLAQAFAELGEDAEAGGLCEWFRRVGHGRAGPLPVEVELELTTDDPLPETTIRPRGDRVPRRQLTDLDAVTRLAEQLAVYDDRLLFLGGHGDPLLHPRFPEICRRVRLAGVYGLGAATTLVELSDTALEALFTHQFDVLEVRLDAHTADTYRRVHQADHFQRVLANIQRIEQLRRDRLSPQPLIVCSLTRCAATLGEMEAFFDHWIRATGSVMIHGYNHYCGRMPPDSLLPLHPPVREPCRRLETRLILLADGTVPLCSQDIPGNDRLGNWISEPITKIWGGNAFHIVQKTHQQLTPENPLPPICRACEEWFRP